MIDDGIEGGNTAVVHLWRCERNVAEGRRSEFAHVLTPPGNPLHASVGLRVGTPVRPRYRARCCGAAPPVLLVTYLTGTRLNRRRGQSNILPVVHLVNNILLLILAFIQVFTGLGIVRIALLK